MPQIEGYNALGDIPSPNLDLRQQQQRAGGVPSGDVMAQQAAQLLEANGVPLTAENMNRAMAAMTGGGNAGLNDTLSGASAASGGAVSGSGSGTASDIIGDQMGDATPPTPPRPPEQRPIGQQQQASLQDDPTIASSGAGGGSSGGGAAPGGVQDLPSTENASNRAAPTTPTALNNNAIAGGTSQPPIPGRRPDELIAASLMVRQIMQLPPEGRMQALQQVQQIYPQLLPFITQALDSMISGVQAGNVDTSAFPTG